MADTFASKIKAALEAALRETGVQLLHSTADVAIYTAQRAAHLSTIVGQEGFDEALQAERDAVCLFAGVSAVKEADAADARIVGLIQGALAIGVASVA